MKKILLILLFLFVAFSCYSQDVFYNSTPTLEWDAVIVDGEGNPFLPGDVIEYEVYIWDRALGSIESQPFSSLTFIGTTLLTEQVLNFPYRAEWECAVRVKHTDGDLNILYSGYGYSTQGPPVTATGPFAYIPYFQGLPAPQGLRDSGI